MVHLIMVVQTRARQDDEWANYLRSLNHRLPNGGTQFPIVREIRIYDISMKEEIVDEFISDLKPFLSDEEFVNTSKWLKLLLKFYPKLELIDLDKYEAHEDRFSRPGRWCKLLLLGKYKDDYDDKGREMA